MTSEEENQRLTMVGPGTPMGELLRRYWHPVAAASALQVGQTLPVRLLGEDIVLFRGEDGQPAAIGRFCAHRGGDLAHGLVEDGTLRCAHHGWLYDAAGTCLEQPLEEWPHCDEVRLSAYDAEIRGGLLWVYMGPEPALPNPEWAIYGWDDAIVRIAVAYLPCNWLQCQEEAIELLPGIDRGHARPREAEIRETDYGFAVIEAGRPEEILKVALWPHGAAVVEARSCRLEWRVPVDDTHTLIVLRLADRPAPGSEIGGERNFSWQMPVRDDDSGAYPSRTEMGRKFALWISQDKILDRTRERLGAADRGVVQLRQKFLSQANLVADGGTPKSVAIRGVTLQLPEMAEATNSKGEEPAAAIDGQPPEALNALEHVLESWRRDECGPT